MTAVDLRGTSNRGYHPGRPYWIRSVWLIVEAILFTNPVIVSYGFKRWLLRRFGADVGARVVIKPGVHIKYPWRLAVGDSTWLGERCWIDNMEDVRIGANVVVSQSAYLCTGNHDWSDPGMPLTPQPIVIEDGAWIGACARVGPGLTVGHGAVVALGSVLLESADHDWVYVGNPAARVKRRVIRGGDARVRCP